MLAVWTLPVVCGQEADDGPSDEAARTEALRVLNDSAWAHTVTPATQDTACDWEHPAFPGLIPENMAAMRDAEYPAGSRSETVQPDTGEYVIRWLSVKPVQAAIERIMALDDRWRFATTHLEARDDDGPTDLAQRHYNGRDMITIAVILKRPGAGGSSFLDYAFRDQGKVFPSSGWVLWPCAGLKTQNGQVHAYLDELGVSGFLPRTQAISLSFPRLLHGKPLISGAHERVQFRFVARQRVFETTFTINSQDVLDGSEAVAYFSSALQ